MNLQVKFISCMIFAHFKYIYIHFSESHPQTGPPQSHAQLTPSPASASGTMTTSTMTSVPFIRPEGKI